MSDIIEQISEQARALNIERARASERRLATTLGPMSWHERCRLVVEVHLDGSESHRVRDWSEVSYAEFTRTMQGLVQHRQLFE